MPNAAHESSMTITAPCFSGGLPRGFPLPQKKRARCFCLYGPQAVPAVNAALQQSLRKNAGKRCLAANGSLNPALVRKQQHHNGENMNYSDILIPVDGSEDAKAACRVAAQLTAAIPGRETLHLLHCIAPIPSLIGGEQREKLKQEHEKDAEALFESIRDELGEVDCDIKTYIRYGETAEAIVDAAKELDCTMIIMGTRGVSEIKSIVLGSVSHHVLRHASIPVLLVNKNHSAR